MSMKQTRKEVVRDYVVMSFGVFLMAFAIILFWRPHYLVTGGVSGLTIVVEYYSAQWLPFVIPIWFSNLALNIPLFLVAFKMLGRTYFIRSLYAMVFFSFAAWVMEFLPSFSNEDMLMGSIFGGVICGVGVALIVRAMSSTGGTVLAATILHSKWFKSISMGKLIFACDLVVIVVGFFAFGEIRAMYAIIAVFVSAKVTDAVIEGFSFAKAAYIISDKADLISTEIFTQLKRGVTEITACGMYTKEPRNMMMCIISGRELVQLKQIVRSIDKTAFIVVNDVREVLGLGFGNLEDEGDA